MTIEISALICTRNRAQYLEKALASVVDQSLPRDCYEIIVVDNNSEDETKEVVDHFLDTGNVRYLFEPVAGLSRARNRAWRQARGRYVAFLDDDAVANRDWLASYLRAFETAQPLPGSIGGKCEPIWEVPRPEWLHEKLLSSLSVYDWSPEPVVLGPDQWVSGCNVAYPVRILEQVGGFREDLGRIGPRLLAGEETYVRHQLDRLGYVTRYHPEIVVGHHVSAIRLNKRWFMRHALGTGESAALLAYGETRPPVPVLLGAAIRRLLWTLPRAALWLTARDTAVRFYRRYQVVDSLGFLRGLWQTYRNGRAA